MGLNDIILDYELNDKVLDALQLLDAMTYNHCVRTSEIAREIEAKFKLQTNILSKATLVHDIGKIYITQKILSKPGRLNVLERQIIDLHPYFGYQILTQYDVDPAICALALYHHGLSPPMLSPLDLDPPSDEIKQYALMIHTIDAFEALTTDRSYRRGFSQQEAVEILDRESRHDPMVLGFLHSVTWR